MTAAVPAGLHWYQHNKKASLWQWKAPKTLKTHAMPLLFLLNKSNDICPSIFSITHHPQGFSVCVFSSSFPYFICSTFCWCPFLSEDLISSSHGAWVPTSILATKWAERMKYHTNTALLGFQTQRDAAMKPFPCPNTGEDSSWHHSNGTTHNVWSLHVHDLQQHRSRPG